MVRIYCKNTDTSLDFQEGTSLLEILPAFKLDNPYPILAAKVNNVVEGLKFKVYNNRDVEFLDYRTYGGRGVYCRSLCFLLSKATLDLFPGSKITMRRPISKGYYCELAKADGTALTIEDVSAISARMKEIADAATPFYRHEVRSEDAIALLHKLDYQDKAKLLETSGETYISYYTLGGTVDYYYDTLLPSADYLKVWELTPYRGGMLLRIPNRHKPEELAPFVDQPKTFEVFKENIRWNKIMGLGTVGDVNVACQAGHAADLIQISEALQEKKIVQIAEEIDRRFHSAHQVRLVLITGPSSSGKSTFCRRLSVQLKACGLHPAFFSTDDYFVNRVDTPKFPDGSYDFDNFDTVDHEYLQQDVLKLLSGEEVSIPTYNFVTGLREYNNRLLKLDKDSVLLVEGIHALNPQLTDQVPEDSKFRIFINTITSLSLDDHNFIPTSDIRLLRRIVRDYNKGAFSARETIAQWPNVRGSESLWIYPYQEVADVLFNSSYLIELAVLRNNAQIILGTVPKNCPEYSEAHRLLKFLSYFIPVPDKEIPPTSLMREYVGGSSFKY